MKPSIAFYQPDIPQNVGAAMRLAACMDVDMHVIEPCGFIWKDDHFKRSGMDYRSQVNLFRHQDWESFLQHIGDARLVLLTTKSSIPHTDFNFQENDILLFGRESAGVPETIHQSVSARIKIPMKEGARSLNVINTASLILGEALRQTNSFPEMREG